LHQRDWDRSLGGSHWLSGPIAGNGCASNVGGMLVANSAGAIRASDGAREHDLHSCARIGGVGGTMGTRMVANPGGALVAMVAIVACNSRDRRAADTSVAAKTDTTTSRTVAAVDTAVKKVQTAAGSLAGHEWNDTTILAYTGATSRGEIRESELASRKAT